MGLSLITPPPFYPLTIEDIKPHVGVDVDDSIHDAVLLDCVTDASDRVSVETSRQLITATYAYSFGEIPDNGVVKLPRPPLQSVTSITYIDSDGEEQTVDEDDYRVFAHEHWKGYVHFLTTPSTADRGDAITINYVAGYGYSEDVPGAIKRAIRLIAADWFKNREASTDKATSPISMGVEWLLFPYRIQEFK